MIRLLKHMQTLKPSFKQVQSDANAVLQAELQVLGHPEDFDAEWMDSLLGLGWLRSRKELVECQGEANLMRLELHFWMKLQSNLRYLKFLPRVQLDALSEMRSGQVHMTVDLKAKLHPQIKPPAQISPQCSGNRIYLSLWVVSCSEYAGDRES